MIADGSRGCWLALAREVSCNYGPHSAREGPIGLRTPDRTYSPLLGAQEPGGWGSYESQTPERIQKVDPL